MLIVLYAVAALICGLALVYVMKDLAPDLLLLGGCALVSAVWLIAAAVFGLRAYADAGPAEAVTFWGYIATGLLLPVAGIYLGFLERTKWASLAIAALCATEVFLAYRLPQIWPEGFYS